MAKTKISTLNLRVEPGIKAAIREAAEREHRSVANMVEMLIRRHCDQEGIRVAGNRQAPRRAGRSGERKPRNPHG